MASGILGTFHALERLFQIFLSFFAFQPPSILRFMHSHYMFVFSLLDLAKTENKNRSRRTECERRTRVTKKKKNNFV